jgi:hypothetical protein
VCVFELRVLCLLGRCCTVWAMPPSPLDFYCSFWLHIYFYPLTISVNLQVRNSDFIKVTVDAPLCYMRSMEFEFQCWNTGSSMAMISTFRAQTFHTRWLPMF